MAPTFSGLLGHGGHVVVVWLLGTKCLQDNHGQKWQYSHGQLDTIGIGDLKLFYTIFYMFFTGFSWTVGLKSRDILCYKL